MLVIGFLLILLAAAAIAYVLLATAGDPAVQISYGVLNVEITPLWLYLAGVLTLLVAALGVWIVGVGARTKARRGREVRELRKQARETDRRATRTGDSQVPPRTGAAGTTGARTAPPTGPRPTTTTPPATGTGPRTTTPPPGTTRRNPLDPDA
ncbi:LapA family protein [Ornithinimicrobium avium]|uniref:LapA family protein n=2 Tax=Ornithinimicrobium avium TaxID=2283195 RepID=A0A345NQ36_9MICO|nr:LapA family protein [Ornithinimicrobium avium]